MTLFWLAAIGLLILGVVEGLPAIVVWPLFGLAVLGMLTSVYLTVRRVRRVHIAIGSHALVGRRAIVRTPLAPNGYVFIQGERWQAEIEDGTAVEGDTVEIVAAEGFHLRVRKLEQA